MAKIALRGMQFYAFHGYYEFERRTGNSFVLDVETDIDMPADPDDQIENTINYEDIYAICQKYMQMKYSLLESVAYDIAAEIKSTFSMAKKVKVVLQKKNPPLNGKVDCSEITIEL